MKRVAEVKITIENCNNISKGVISLEEEKLNIRYGMNGTGKSTLSTAISLFSQISLDKTCPILIISHFDNPFSLNELFNIV